MLRKTLNFFKKYIFFVLFSAILIFSPLYLPKINAGASTDDKNIIVLNIWQIDNFEGGQGSRTGYLQRIGDDFRAENSNVFIKVNSVSSESIATNLNNGNIPDMISYGAGITGLENYLSGEAPYVTWCRGGYCILAVDESADFTDISPLNTVINSGKDNLTGAVALLCGLNGAKEDNPTSAYLKLIGQKYKYLLGTQRDIFRLKTRNTPFKVFPVNVFNDLYQDISITTNDDIKRDMSERFIKFLIGKSGNLESVGLMHDDVKIYNDEMSAMENIDFKYTIKCPISENYKKELKRAIANNNSNKLKNLLK